MIGRPCLDCGAITRATRCAACATRRARMVDARRGTRQERGYGGAWPVISGRVIARDGGVCHWCGGPATTADHLVPKVRGGTDDDDNLVAACRSCNSSRGGRAPSETLRE